MASFILPIISGLTGLFSGGAKKQTDTNFNNKTDQSQSGTTSGSTSPNFSPLQQQLMQMFTNGAINQYNQGTDLSGYKNQGIRDINSTGNAARKNLDNSIASRGLSFSPAAANADTSLEQGRIGNIQNFLQTIPLLQRQIQQQNIQGLQSAFGIIPTGTNSTGTSNVTGTSTSSGTGQQIQSSPGGWLSGLFSGLGQGLNAPSTPGGGQNNLGSILGSLGFK